MAQSNYWKKRCSIRWAKVGEETTKFFHAMGTKRYRQNAISSLRTQDGIVTSDHQQMAGMLWDNFRQRMGQTEGIQMGFDLNSLLTKIDGLSSLSKPFEKEEKDDVIKFMPSDKAPGPDGFNGLFLKKC